MRIEVPFGESSVTAAFPASTFVIPPAGGEKPEPLADLDAAVRAAFDAPLESPPIEALAKPGAWVTVAFDDPTVPAYGPIRRVLLLETLRRLESAGVQRQRIRVICANALHRKFRREELAFNLGEDLVEALEERLTCHDAEDAGNLVHLGKTPEGWDVELNRAVVESDLTVYLTAAHFRGFAGGWKSLCVGLSTYRSIRHHHTPDGMSMSVDGNPMHATLESMGRLAEASIPGKLFKADAIEAGPFQTAAVFAGNTWATRRAALERLRAMYPPRRDLSSERYDVIVYGVPAWSPYAIFARMNPILTLLSSGLGYLGGVIQALGKPGCTVIMATPCPDEWDETHHPSYRDVWENVLGVTRDPYEIMREHAEAYAARPDYIRQYREGHAFHPVHGILGVYPLRRLAHCGRVIVAGVENPATAHHLGFEASGSIEEALDMAREEHGPEMSAAYARHPAAPTKVAM